MEHFKSSKQSAGESSIERDRLYWTKVGINSIQPVMRGGGGGGGVGQKYLHLIRNPLMDS